MDEEEQTPSKPAQAKPSQVPSWVTLGFVLGALFVMALPRRGTEEARLPARDAGPERPAKPAAAPRITTIEAVFAAWDRYAVWSNNTTEVALWNTDAMGYSDCYEVLKTSDGYYFRSIPKLTRPILTHGVVQESPLQFTETLRQRQEWLGEVDRENLKALSEAARQTLPVLTEEPQGK
jgi:hypothetical protein